MYKVLILVVCLFSVNLSAEYISKKKIIGEKKSLQVSSCKDRECIKITQDAIESYDYITVVEGEYFVTYLVNIEKKDEEKILDEFKYLFPDMILRKRYIENKELYRLKALDKDFFNNKNYKTKVKTKKINLYSKPTIKSEVIDTKYLGEDVDIDGCNVYEWCKEKDEKKYLPLYKIDLYEKIKPTKKEQKFDSSSFIGKYKLALKYYKEKKYSESYKILNELFELKGDDKNINYYLGRNAFKMKMYYDAQLAYERFLFEDPNNTRVKLEMARSFFMMQDFLEAKELFLEIKKDPNLPEQMEKVVDFHLALIDRKISKHFVSGMLMMGINYDSNINSRSNNDTFSNVYLPSFNTYLDLNNTTKDQDAFYNQEVALVNYYYKLDDNKKIKQDFMFFNKDSFISAANTTDVTLYSYTPSFTIQHNKNLLVDYALYTDIMWYGGYKYLQTYALYPKVTYAIDENSILKGYFKYQSKSYKKSSYKYKDSFYTEAGASLSHKLNPKWKLTPSIVFENEEKKSGTTVGVDYSGVKLGLSTTYMYKPTLTFTPSLTYNYSAYDGKDANYLVQQVDKELKVGLSSIYVHTPKWIVQSSFNYTDQSSTIQSNEYDKYTFGVNIIRMF